MEERKMILRTCNGVDFEVDMDVASEMLAVKDAVRLADGNIAKPFKMDGICSCAFNAIIEYCKLRVDAEASNLSEENMKQRQAEFLNSVHPNLLFDLLKAAYALDIPSLVDLISAGLSVDN